MKRRTTLVSGGVALGLVLVSAGAVGIAVRDRSDTGSELAPIVVGQSVAAPGRVPGESVEAIIERLKARVESAPNDYVSWATLGFHYVEQARINADPALYSDADEALARSLAINDTDNFTAYTGLAAVAAARHDFATAERHALAGLSINAASASLYGILSDAQIQLGKYDEGFESVQRMVDLSPDTASLSRVSYTHELTGDVAGQKPSCDALSTMPRQTTIGRLPCWIWVNLHLARVTPTLRLATISRRSSWHRTTSLRCPARPTRSA